MQIGLFFGSFNPIHTGHLIIANHIAEHTQLDSIWFVVSPQNPLKDSATLLDEHDRLHLVNLAIKGDHRFQASNVEFDMPRPSYTTETLARLKDKYPTHSFSVLMGSDNLASLPKWKNYQAILDHYVVYAYRRPGFIDGELPNHPNITLFEDTPFIYITATNTRDQIREGYCTRYLLPHAVWVYIEKMGLYK